MANNNVLTTVSLKIYGCVHMPATRYIVEDAFARMSSRSVTGERLRGKLGVVFVNDAGMSEMGIDAGGLFKELWTELSSKAFDPDFGLFRTSDGADKLL